MTDHAIVFITKKLLIESRVYYLPFSVLELILFKHLLNNVGASCVLVVIGFKRTGSAQ